MKYYVEDAEQTEEVQKKIDEIKYKNVNPEEIKIIEPCCGSGHILVYVFDLLYKMYEERGYQSREIPTLILKNNLTGLDVDKRAAQLASFSLIMKARSVNNRFFNDQYYVTPHVYELKDSKVLKKMGYKKHLKDLNLLSDDEIALFDYIVDTFENGKTIGSLLKVKAIDFECLDSAIKKIKGTVSSLFNVEFLSVGIKRLEELSNLAKILSGKYDVMITNPPYRAISTMEEKIGEYASVNYPNSKTDMFAMFMETEFVRRDGFTAMVNMHNWMTISSYEELRKSFMINNDIVVMSHLGPHAFEAIGGEIVQTTAFVARKGAHGAKGVFYNLVDSSEKESDFFAIKNNKESDYLFKVSSSNFKELPGSPYAYWISSALAKDFDKGESITKFVDTFQGIITGDNPKYLRLWHEVVGERIPFHASRMDEIDLSRKYWIPYNKGGEIRKWYGVQDYVVYWKNGPEDKTRGKKGFSDYYLREYVAWSYTVSNTIATRYYPEGFLWDVRGSGIFDKANMLYYLEGLISSKIGIKLLRINNSTPSCQVENIVQFPIILDNEKKEQIDSLVKDNNDISHEDWDSYEISWDYKMHPFLQIDREYALDGGALAVKNVATYYGESPEVKGSVEACYLLWEAECKKRFDQLKINEEELNRIFIDIYGLQDELTPEIEDKDVTVRLADKERDIRSLISYLVGIAMGRYSLDVPGLAYAGGEWNPSKYVSYQPDDDGIIPIYTGIGMEDGLTTILIDLIKHIFGEDTYRANIDFIAEALGKNSHESSEETLNRYLNDGFYADHLKIYQKRPIYWLFTSGKKAGFKCLIYMHRYNADTLARINGKYFLPESTRKKNELDELNGKIAHSDGREKIRYEKERQNLAAAYNEAVEYGQVLDHMANQYISIDLDDGVKVNYAKFQGIELVTDGGSKVKKDLLSPLK